MRPWAAGVLAAAIVSSCLSAPEREAVAEEYYNLGNAYLAAGKVERATALFQRAIDIEPALLQAHYNLSLALVRAGKGEQALTLLTDLLSRDPGNLMVLSLLGYADYRLGRYQDALGRYDEVLGHSPDDRNALYNRAMVLWKLDRTGEAADLLQKVADRVQPDDLATAALLRLADIYEQTGSWDKVSATLERYLEWKSDDEPVLVRLAHAYREQEKYLPALEAYRRAASLDQADPEPWIGQAELLLTVVEDPETGLRALERALRDGFKDKARLATLLADPHLLEKDRVKLLLAQWGFSDLAEPGAAAPAGGQPPAGAQPATGAPPGSDAQPESGGEPTGREPRP